MLINLPANTLGLGAVDILFYGKAAPAPAGTQTPEQWSALEAILAPMAAPPLGTKPVTGATRTGIKNAAPAPVTVPAK